MAESVFLSRLSAMTEISQGLKSPFPNRKFSPKKNNAKRNSAIQDSVLSSIKSKINKNKAVSLDVKQPFYFAHIMKPFFSRTKKNFVMRSYKGCELLPKFSSSKRAIS